MQRIVSGEGINGPEATSDLPRNNSESESSGFTMPHSPSVAFGDTPNFVESDGGYNAEDDGGGMTDTDDTIATFPSRSSIQENHQEGSEPSSQQLNFVSPSIPINFAGSSTNDRREFIAATTQQHQQTPSSIISGLLPAVGLIPISRNDSRNSRISGTSFGSGLQRSQNSSRDWGWFEDVHHSDQSVTGSISASARTGRNNKNEGATSVASSGTNITSLPQHQLSNPRTGSLVHSGGIGNKGNREASTEGQNSRMSSHGDNDNHHTTIKEGGGNVRNNKDTKNNQLRARGRGDTNRTTASLLPTGDEMIVDETQEYLEPIPIPKPVDMENGEIVKVL